MDQQLQIVWSTFLNSSEAEVKKIDGNNDADAINSSMVFLRFRLRPSTGRSHTAALCVPLQTPDLPSLLESWQFCTAILFVRSLFAVPLP